MLKTYLKFKLSRRIYPIPTSCFTFLNEMPLFIFIKD